MKFYIYRFNKNSGFKFKRTKCNDYWSNNFKICWQYSEKGAKGIVGYINSHKKNNLYTYGIVAVDKVDEMLEQYEKQTDKETYMAEEMNSRPWWI